jgi:hypothetical protein
MSLMSHYSSRFQVFFANVKLTTRISGKSTGNLIVPILILGFHGLLISLFRKFFQVSIADFGLAALIVAVFVPIIMLAEKYFPLILGKYRISSR